MWTPYQSCRPPSYKPVSTKVNGRLPCLSPSLVQHESPVAKQVGLRHARLEEVIGQIRIRVLHVLILARGCRRPRVSVLRRSRSFGIVHSLDFAKLAAHLLVPGRRPVLPLVLLQPVLGTVNGGRSARGRRHVFQRRGRFLPGAGSTGTAIPATERVSAVEPEYIFPAEIEHDQHQLIGNINLIGQSTVQNKWKPSANQLYCEWNPSAFKRSYCKRNPSAFRYLSFDDFERHHSDSDFKRHVRQKERNDTFCAFCMTSSKT